jgi:hypothetical protein
MKNAQTQIGANPMITNTVHEIGKSEGTKRGLKGLNDQSSSSRSESKRER